MIASTAVTIVVNGSIIAGVAPARIAAGRVVAPLSPVVVRLASRVAYDPVAATIVVERNALRIVVPVSFVENDVPYVEVATVVRGLGGSAIFDSHTKTLAIVLQRGDAIATPRPYDPTQPRVAPTALFTPAPPPPTPRALEPGIPRPRRTAIPVTPSQPAVAPSPNEVSPPR